MKRLALAAVLLLVCAAASAQSFDFRLYPYVAVGYATYAPTAEKTLASAPDAGVTLPSNAEAMVICVESNPIRYFLGGDTAATGSLGLKLDIGCYALGPNRNAMTGFRFIDSSAGASAVTIQYFAKRR